MCAFTRVSKYLPRCEDARDDVCVGWEVTHISTSTSQDQSSQLWWCGIAMFFHGKLETSSADCLEDPSLGLCTNVWLLFFGRLISLFQGSCRSIKRSGARSGATSIGFLRWALFTLLTGSAACAPNRPDLRPENLSLSRSITAASDLTTSVDDSSSKAMFIYRSTKLLYIYFFLSEFLSQNA